MKKASVYRHYDKDGVLLYVGVSSNANRRLKSHKDKSWYLDIASMSVEHHEDRQSALLAEAKAIRDENPIHNTMRPKVGEGVAEIAPIHPSMREIVHGPCIPRKLGYICAEEPFIDGLIYSLEIRGVSSDLIFVDRMKDYVPADDALSKLMETAVTRGTGVVIPFPPCMPQACQDVLLSRGVQLLTCSPDGVREINQPPLYRP